MSPASSSQWRAAKDACNVAWHLKWPIPPLITTTNTMSAFEDDVEPVEDLHSRGGTPVGGVGRGKQRERPMGGAVLGKHGRELSPEPDEELDTTDGKHTMWLVKVPRFLLQGWTKVDEEDRQLGTVRVYE